MTLLRTSALFIGLAALGIACGSDSSNSPDAPNVGGNGGAKTDGPITPGTGGATGSGGATVPSNGGAIGGFDSGAGGSTVVIDAGSTGGSTGIIDSGIDGTGGGSIDGGTDTIWTKPIHVQIINVATAGGLDVTGPTPVAYTSCK